MLELIVTVFILQEIDRKEARINAMRCAILETFPEPNRRLLQRCSLSLFSPRCLGNDTHTHTHIKIIKRIMEGVQDLVLLSIGNIVKTIFQDMVYRMMMMISFHIYENYYIL